MPIVYICPSKCISRIHGRPSVSRAWDDQNYSRHGKQPCLQYWTLWSLEDNQKHKKTNCKGQNPLSNGSSMQVHFQRRPPKHKPVLCWHHFHDCQGTTPSTSYLSRKTESHGDEAVGCDVGGIECSSCNGIEAGPTQGIPYHAEHEHKNKDEDSGDENCSQRQRQNPQGRRYEIGEYPHRRNAEHPPKKVHIPSPIAVFITPILLFNNAISLGLFSPSSKRTPLLRTQPLSPSTYSCILFFSLAKLTREIFISEGKNDVVLLGLIPHSPKNKKKSQP